MDIFQLITLLTVLCTARCEDTSSQDEILSKNLKKLALANNRFGINLYQKIASSSENVIFSPFTIYTVLAMLYTGAKGETAQELKQLLGYRWMKLDDDVILDAFHSYLVDNLTKIDPNICTISFASAVVVDGSFSLDKHFKKKIEDVFQAYVYDESTISDDGKDVGEQINAWAMKKTNGTIKSLVDYVDSATMFILASAAYFKGTWQVKFEPEDTKYHFFYNEGNVFQRSEVLMMHAYTSYRYYEDEGEFAAVEMEYDGKNMSMIIFLPQQLDGLQYLEQSMSPAKISFVRRYMDHTKMHLTLPKFKQEFNRDLSEELKDLGLSNIFSSAADFSGMTEDKSSPVLDEIKHKAVIDINEEGSVAASISNLIMAKMISFDYIPEFKVDHPFLYVIIDTISEMILFMGRINQL